MTRIVGIDLGTTHTALAWADDPEHVEALTIPQLVAPSQIERRALLPSCLYATIEGESHDDPWQDAPWVGGELARQRASEVPGRTITSAKSWLCHGAVDRTAAILPWGSTDSSMPKLSPLQVSTRLLVHLARAWEAAFVGRSLSRETIVLTVPASFDEVARDLTLRAASDAGLTVSLLEEPQAAFYDALHDERPIASLAESRGGQADVLVCDVGGGTTDLSIIRATIGQDATLSFERVAVGRHILLGGDNMDLALAHLLEPRIKKGERLDPARFSQLVLACRGAKESLLSADAPAGVTVSLLSRGSQLVGSVMRAEISREEVQRIVLEGFFPESDLDAAPPPRGGLMTFGLPYERDVAITRHVKSFLNRHGGRVDAILPNGGVFRASAVVARLARTLGDVMVLPNADPDLAVARGAVRHGLARAGTGRRIVAGSARAYYVGLAGAETRGVCVLPRGANEGEPHMARDTEFALALGKPIRFDLYASDREQDRAGEVVTITPSFDKLAPLAAHFNTATRGAPATARVVIEAELAVTGTMAIACVEKEPPHRRHSLSFDLRAERSSIPAPPSVPPTKVDAARAAIEAVFGKVASGSPKDLVIDLERLLGERASWDAMTARALFDLITRSPGSRRRSVDHERAFFALVGTCLRPGYGAPGDVARAALMARLFGERLGFPEETRGWQQFFVAYRRIAGGLDEAAQGAIRDQCDGVIAPKEKKVARQKKFQPRAESELVEMCAALERVSSDRRAELGEWLLERTWVTPSPGVWASIGRIGAREPAYASAHHVIGPAVVERWLDHLLRANWAVLTTAPLAASRMAKITGDRARDISDCVRHAVLAKLDAARAGDALVRPLREVVAPSEAERADFYGESLPLGLSLVSD